MVLITSSHVCIIPAYKTRTLDRWLCNEVLPQIEGEAGQPKLIFESRLHRMGKSVPQVLQNAGNQSSWLPP